MDWGEVYECQQADDAYDTFLSLFTGIYNDHFPLTIKRSGCRKKFNQPWITPAIINSCNTKNRLYRRYLRHPSVVNKHLFKTFRNQLTSIIRLAKKTFYANKFEKCKNNMKSTWREINNVLGKGKRPNIPDKCHDEQQVFSSSTDIAGAFNSYFTNIGETLANTVPSTNAHFMDYLHNTNTSSLFSFQQILMKSPRLLRNSTVTLAVVLMMFGLQLLSLSFPLFLILLLIYLTFLFSQALFLLTSRLLKSPPSLKEDIHNYRPISVLPCFSKILEMLVYNRLSKFLAKFNILYDYQYGFRTKHSTDMAHIHLTDLISNSLCDKLCTAGVFIDLFKAFDTIDHNILLSKLDFYGVRGCALQWFKNYLDSRQQFTVINNCKSVRTYISHGVPQGSILGSLLFLLYVNDLHSSSSLLSFFVIC